MNGVAKSPGATSRRLLTAHEPNPVAVNNSGGTSPVLLLGDHAGGAIPARLASLGLGASDRHRHIALDIGVAGLGRELARRLDATFIRQRYSRLVVDCNRDPREPGSIVVQSDGAFIAGNRALGAAQRRRRVREIFRPYHNRIAAELDARSAQSRRTILVSLHSFTPELGGTTRPWRFGVLHNGDSPFSRAVLNGLRAIWGGAKVGENQPYAMDGHDFTVPFHAHRRGLDYLELEVRQDLITEAPDQIAAGRDLAEVLRLALLVSR